jgi:hypothetical protein
MTAVITDAGADPRVLEAMREAGVEVLVAEVSAPSFAMGRSRG